MIFGAFLIRKDGINVKMKNTESNGLKETWKDAVVPESLRANEIDNVKSL